MTEPEPDAPPIEAQPFRRTFGRPVNPAREAGLVDGALYIACSLHETTGIIVADDAKLVAMTDRVLATTAVLGLAATVASRAKGFVLIAVGGGAVWIGRADWEPA